MDPTALHEAVKTSSTAVDTVEAEASGSGAPDEDFDVEAHQQELDDEATALLAELESSKLEVQQLIRQQQEQSTELGGMRDHITSELEELQDEAWRLQVYAELEMLKGQLSTLSDIQTQYDTAAAASGVTAIDLNETEEEILENEDINALQDKLDAELEQMFAQLQAVKKEAQLVAAKKASLEAELVALLQQQADMLTEDEVSGLALTDAVSRQT